jgi:hypothetical protein
MNSDDAIVGFLNISLLDPGFEMKAYGYVGTLGGIAEFIKNCVYHDWPLGSLPQLLDMMKLVTERILEHPPDKPGKDWHHKVELARAILDNIESIAMDPSNVSTWAGNEKLGLHFFELGAHWGALAALFGEAMPFLKKAFHSQKSSEGPERRWAHHNTVKEEILGLCREIAINLWEDGDGMMHHTMADYLLSLDEIKTKNRTTKTVAGEIVETQHITPARLRKELLPIAVSLGRLHGVKKTK